MAYSDTIASRWYTQAQALNYVSNNWDVLEPALGRDDIDQHQDEYLSILQDITTSGSVENCGGIARLAHKYCISEDLVSLFVADIKYCIQLYKESL